MRDLPAGTVTFLFTDIEGSTRMLQELGDAYANVLLEHRRVLRDVWERHNGVEFGTEGDAFFVAFTQATDAANAALDAQAALATGQVRVRIGIHTGEPLIVAGDYVGLDVHRAARISSAAHGGQIVISERTRAFLTLEVTDLGLHRLKDLTAPERLFQLGAGSFPPLRSLNATNLPTQPSPLIGRQREIAELTQLVQEHRVVTLTGPGGTGKTRLSLQVAAECIEHFKDGTFFVPLAMVADPRLVLPTLASTIGTDQALEEFIAAKVMLILLDNVEQVLACASEIATLMQRCPNLRFLVTSRAPLRIAGEREYAVDPLPDADAITLFRERAVRADLNEDVVREICRRLDRLPLAVELAAARTRIFSAEQLLERLTQRLSLLTGGRRDLPERHRTLRATIEWSHDLLALDAQALFARTAVFAGSFGLDAAEEIADATIDGLETLVEESLLRAEGERFAMLETIREYAHERLDAMPNVDELRERHALFFVALAEQVARGLEGDDAGTWIEKAVLDEDNLRAALTWLLERNKPQEALRMCIGLTDYWEERSQLDEGTRWFERATNLSGHVDPRVRATADRDYGTLMLFKNQPGQATALLQESVVLWREIGDRDGLSSSLRALGSILAVDAKTHPDAKRALEEALEIAAASGSAYGERRALHLLGEIYRDEGDFEEGARIFERSIALASQMGASIARAATTHSYADLELDRGDLAHAEELYRDTLRAAVENRLDRHKVYCLAGLAAVAARRGDPAQASFLWRAVERAEEDLGFRILDVERARYAREVARVPLEDVPAPALDECVEIALR